MAENIDFGAVWDRVMSGGERPAQDLKARLEGFLDDEAHDCRVYADLAARTRGDARRTLLRLSADEAGHRKRLNAEYYLVTGGCCEPKCAAETITCVLETLRRQYQGELAGAAEYERAAREGSDERRAELFRCLAEDEKRHSRAIACILGRAV